MTPGRRHKPTAHPVGCGDQHEPARGAAREGMAMCGFTRCGVPEGLATVERFMRAFEVGDLTDGQCQGHCAL